MSEEPKRWRYPARPDSGETNPEDSRATDWSPPSLPAQFFFGMLAWGVAWFFIVGSFDLSDIAHVYTLHSRAAVIRMLVVSVALAWGAVLLWSEAGWRAHVPGIVLAAVLSYVVPLILIIPGAASTMIR